MLVLDGVVKELNIDPESGKADLSSAEQSSGANQVGRTRGRPDVEEDVVLSHRA
jgi:hypothetical protein